MIKSKIDDALVLGERIQQVMANSRPLLSVLEQLRYLCGIYDRDQNFEAAPRERLTIGLIAAREFGTTEPEFARLLYDISHAIKENA